MAMTEQNRTGGSGFAGIDMADNNDVDVSLFFTTGSRVVSVTFRSSSGWL